MYLPGISAGYYPDYNGYFSIAFTSFFSNVFMNKLRNTEIFINKGGMQ